MIILTLFHAVVQIIIYSSGEKEDKVDLRILRKT